MWGSEAWEGYRHIEELSTVMGLPEHKCISWMLNGTLEGVDGNRTWLDLRLPVGHVGRRDCRKGTAAYIRVLGYKNTAVLEDLGELDVME